MKVGTVRERKKYEYRVGITPINAKEYIKNGHQVFVETNAGEGSGYTDDMYKEVGCTICPTMEEVYKEVDMMVKVKEPLPEEYELIKSGMILFTYLHLAADKTLTKAIAESKCKAVAYETIEDEGMLPCLQPMSQIAGRLSIQEGAKYIEAAYGGRGIILGGIPGVGRGQVTIIGGGIVGTYAAKTAIGIGAQVTILDKSLKRLNYLDDIFGNNITTLYASEENVIKSLRNADLVIGAALIPGGKTPHVIKKEHLKEMKKGSVIVDVAIDQGGCAETSHVTYHDNPVFIYDGIVHYCVGNMPGAVPRTSTIALTNATTKYGLLIANLGLEEAIKQYKSIETGLNYYEGKCTNANVAKAQKNIHKKVL